MHRFYCPDADFHNPQIAITDPKELHHLRDVLRLKKGDAVTIFNTQGEEAAGCIAGTQKSSVIVAVESLRREASPLPVITLACAIPKKSKFEWIIEKATELGVDEIMPLKTRRTEIDLKGERLTRKMSRYQDVAVNAAKQCRRLRVPVIQPLADFATILESLPKETTVFIPSLVGERRNIFEAFKSIPTPSRIAFLIGPEGDFAPAEYAFAREHGFIAISLGKTVLKVETAAIAVIACAQLFYRDN